ncbi:hypothetical protein NEPAR06_1685 [Nematocida parisii]|nr:hypothetical protein NEPAR08_1714 [Nematocida parisii]KAI5129739.1 hypothetical protein NEPAR03_1774 [Nematocida parisii]KAI5142801.1 hypothetical protein NEPAR04_1623 [Nematocida parisii]KAI5145432.1 hypothetical protein NEPAR07_1683 [Nematocida parisii]KAI5155266.1 hypothetical protein NEPAR06_1685 [Nematocida parisii]
MKLSIIYMTLCNLHVCFASSFVLGNAANHASTPTRSISSSFLDQFSNRLSIIKPSINFQNTLEISENGINNVFAKYDKYKKSVETAHSFNLYDGKNKLDKKKIELHCNTGFRSLVEKNHQNSLVISRILSKLDSSLNNEFKSILYKVDLNDEEDDATTTEKTAYQKTYISQRYLNIIGLPNIIIDKLIKICNSYDYKITTAKDAKAILDYLVNMVFNSLDYSTYGLVSDAYGELVRAIVLKINLFVTNELSLLDKVKEIKKTKRLKRKLMRVVTNLNSIKEKTLDFRRSLQTQYNLVSKIGNKTILHVGEFSQIKFDPTSPSQLNYIVTVLRPTHGADLSALQASINSYINGQEKIITKLIDNYDKSIDSSRPSITAIYNIFKYNYDKLFKLIVGIQLEQDAEKKNSIKKKIDRVVKKISTISDIDKMVIDLYWEMHNGMERAINQEIMAIDIKNLRMKYYPVDQLLIFWDTNYKFIEKLNKIQNMQKCMAKITTCGLDSSCKELGSIIPSVLNAIKKLIKTIEKKTRKLFNDTGLDKDRAYKESMQKLLNILNNQILPALSKNSLEDNENYYYYELLESVINEILPEYKKIWIIMEMKDTTQRNHLLLSRLFYLNQLECSDQNQMEAVLRDFIGQVHNNN